MTTKADIIATVASATGHSQAVTKQIVDETMAVIGDGLANHRDVKIDGLGNFTVKATQARAGRNPATGEAIEIPAGHKISFKPAAGLKSRL